MKASRPISSLSLLLLVIIGACAWWQRQYIYDEWQLVRYDPPAEVIRYADQTTMTNVARRSFYVNHPALKDRGNFAQFCTNATEETVVLGCYLSPQRGIYLLNVENTELEGIEQVTAAHEMLHAQYDRLDTAERQRIDKLLQNYYDNDLKDETIRKTIDGYRTSEPKSVINEMHSIIGSQVANLPAELETYYAQYFTDRSTVIEFYGRYDAAFSKRQAQIKQYDERLISGKKAISVLQSDIERQSSALAARRQRLNADRSSGDTSSYNNGVSAYNSSVNSYNYDLARLKIQIRDYNLLVEQRNAIAFEEQELVKSITAPAQAQQ